MTTNARHLWICGFDLGERLGIHVPAVEQTGSVACVVEWRFEILADEWD
jgi:hypothetical protein